MKKYFILLSSFIFTSLLFGKEDFFEPFLIKGEPTNFFFIQPSTSLHIYNKGTIDQIEKNSIEKNINLYSVITKEDRYPIDLLRIYFTADEEYIDIDKFIFKRKGMMPITLNIQEALTKNNYIDFNIYIETERALEKIGSHFGKKELVEIDLFSSGGFKFTYILNYEEAKNLYETAIFYKENFRIIPPKEPILKENIPYGSLMLKEAKPIIQELPSS